MARATEGRRPGGRSARVVAAVMEATFEVLAERGYGGLSVEEVARRAGVNKTTIYRRWPTRAELVRAALMSSGADASEGGDTGDLRGDLCRYLRARVARATPRRRAVSRLLIAESVEPELAEVVRSVREARAAYPIGLVRAAIARGELPRGTAPRLVVEVLMGALYYDLLVGEVPSAARIERVVDLVLDGARGGAAAKSAARGGGRAGA